MSKIVSLKVTAKCFCGNTHMSTISHSGCIIGTKDFINNPTQLTFKNHIFSEETTIKDIKYDINIRFKHKFINYYHNNKDQNNPEFNKLISSIDKFIEREEQKNLSSDEKTRFDLFKSDFIKLKSENVDFHKLKEIIIKEDNVENNPIHELGLYKSLIYKDVINNMDYNKLLDITKLLSNDKYFKILSNIDYTNFNKLIN